MKSNFRGESKEGLWKEYSLGIKSRKNYIERSLGEKEDSTIAQFGSKDHRGSQEKRYQVEIQDVGAHERNRSSTGKEITGIVNLRIEGGKKKASSKVHNQELSIRLLAVKEIFDEDNEEGGTEF